jgi:hypothetical protein
LVLRSSFPSTFLDLGSSFFVPVELNMRHVPITLLALLLFANVVSAQTVTPFNPKSPALTLQGLNARANADMVVARMMTFDRNNDGLVAQEELPDRMRNVMLGDDGRDGVLDRGEIRALVTAPRPVTVPGGGFPGYTVGGVFDLWSSSHVLGALEDLRLPASTRDRALAVVMPFLKSLGPNPGDAERAALVAQLKDLLSDVERDDFRAALGRRPVSKASESIQFRHFKDLVAPNGVVKDGVFLMPFTPEPRVLKN